MALQVHVSGRSGVPHARLAPAARVARPALPMAQRPRAASARPPATPGGRAAASLDRVVPFQLERTAAFATGPQRRSVSVRAAAPDGGPAAAPSSAAASAPSRPSPAPAQGKGKGCDVKKLAICVAIGACVAFSPKPSGVSLQAWRLFGIFLGTIAGIVTQPLPLGAVAMVGLGVAQLTKVLTFPQAFSAFANEIPWLIAAAFWLSGGFIRSGLGSRIAYTLVAAFGKTTLGLTYALVAGEACLAPAIPSVAARAGGLFVPLARALCEACGSYPIGKDPRQEEEGEAPSPSASARRMGSFVMLACFLCTTVSSGMFITAMAANPLAVNLAASSGVALTWGGWALAALVPGLACLVATPLVLYALYPPAVKDTPDAPAAAREALRALGPLSRDEKITAAALGGTVALWIFGGAWGINAVAAALGGLTVLLATDVVTWKQCLADAQAWDTMTWFAALIGMASFLNKFGFIKWFSDGVVRGVQGLGLAWQASFAIVLLLYFYSHYLFASGAAHIGAMYTAFLSVAVASGAPPTVAALALAHLSNLMGCLTTYGIGSAPPYYGQGYVPQGTWYAFGLLFSVVYIAIWVVLGGAWWKFLGLW